MIMTSGEAARQLGDMEPIGASCVKLFWQIVLYALIHFKFMVLRWWLLPRLIIKSLSTKVEPMTLKIFNHSVNHVIVAKLPRKMGDGGLNLYSLL